MPIVASPVQTQLFGPSVALYQGVEADADLGALFAEERALVAAATERRQAQFSVGRQCAHYGLRSLGVPPVAIERGPKREPVWPAAVAGAISHTNGLVVAAVAPADVVRSVGIDVEPNAPLPPDVHQRIIRPDEAEHISQFGPEMGWPLDRLVFSAKESVYKAWYPLAQKWLGFPDASLTIDPWNQRFHAKILVSGPLSEVSGRFVITDGHIITAVEVPSRM